MRSLIFVRLAVIVLAACPLFAAGCSADREQALVGKWKASEIGAMFKAIKMKEDTGVSTQQATEAAKVMAATFVKLQQDKSFTAGMGGATMEGTWTFNKETSEVVLTITAMKGPDGQAMPQAPASWTAYLDDDNRRLAFYPAPPDAVALLRQGKEQGGSTGAISLYK